MSVPPLARLIPTCKRYLRRAALLRYAVPLFNRQRFGMAVRLLARGDLAAFTDRARWVVRGELDRRANAVRHTVDVALQAEPWPADVP
jgi:hypothetical protein